MKKLTFLFVFAFIALFAFAGTALAVEQSVRLTASGWLSTSAQARTLRDCVAFGGSSSAFSVAITSASYNYDYLDVASGATLTKTYTDRDRSSPDKDNGGIKCTGGCYATFNQTGNGESIICHYR